MAREALILVALAALMVVVAVGGADRVRRTGSIGQGAQVLLGLGCGALGALAVAVPYVDLVPDRAEPAVALLTFAILTAAAAKVFGSRSRHRSERRRISG